jgi:hypothetical protein
VKAGPKGFAQTKSIAELACALMRANKKAANSVHEIRVCTSGTNPIAKQAVGAKGCFRTVKKIMGRQYCDAEIIAGEESGSCKTILRHKSKKPVSG